MLRQLNSWNYKNSGQFLDETVKIKGAQIDYVPFNSYSNLPDVLDTAGIKEIAAGGSYIEQLKKFISNYKKSVHAKTMKSKKLDKNPSCAA